MDKIDLLILIFLLATPASGTADGLPFHQRNRRETVTGIIQQKERNTLSILDENDQQLKRFVYTGDQKEFQKGMRVRVHYQTLGNIVIDIQKMTPVEYRDGQNCGYILKKK